VDKVRGLALALVSAQDTMAVAQVVCR
jgi:uncharacterized protein YdeI (YjbR/CyaY-like superfamily)